MTENTTEKFEHHWSGWPGAFCLHCGQTDLWEYAIGNLLYDPFTEKWEDCDDAIELQMKIKEAAECPVGYSENCGQCKYGGVK